MRKRSLFSSSFHFPLSLPVRYVIPTSLQPIHIYTQMSTFPFIFALLWNIFSACSWSFFCYGFPGHLLVVWICSLVVPSRRVHAHNTPWVLVCLRMFVCSFYAGGTTWWHIKSLAYTFFLTYPMSIVHCLALNSAGPGSILTLYEWPDLLFGFCLFVWPGCSNDIFCISKVW